MRKGLLKVSCAIRWWSDLGAMPGDAKEEFVVEHGGEKYNIGKFLHFHPGGRNTLAAFEGRDISQKLQQFEHSDSALYLLKEYKLRRDARGADDLETLVDWNKPMLKQVGQLGGRYSEWVQSPVDRKLRLFESDFVEKLTVTPWYLIPIVWIPVDIILLYTGYTNNKQYLQDSYLPSWLLLSFASGFLFWTLLEYSIHRWLFHLHPPDKSPRLITFHFLMHGLHHKVPFDESRLLIPPVPAAIVVAILYSLFYTVLPVWVMNFFAAGTLAGYVVYDLTHFYLHYGSPRPNTFFYHMKRYHNHHHFTEPDNGYGISCDIWDRVFRTQIYLKKLKFTLKW